MATDFQPQFLALASQIHLSALAQSLLSEFFKPDSRVGKIVAALLDDQYRDVLLKVLWALCILVLLFGCTGLTFSIYWIAGSYKPGIFISVLFSSIFLGVTALLFLPPKAIVATFGGLLGVGPDPLNLALARVLESNSRASLTGRRLPLRNSTQFASNCVLFGRPFPGFRPSCS